MSGVFAGHHPARLLPTCLNGVNVLTVELVSTFVYSCISYVSRLLRRLEGPTTFTNNWANRAAGIYNPSELSIPSNESFEERYGREYKEPIITFPEDTVFEDNSANVSLERLLFLWHTRYNTF